MAAFGLSRFDRAAKLLELVHPCRHGDWQDGVLRLADAARAIVICIGATVHRVARDLSMVGVGSTKPRLAL